jgi:hypothetical protein
MDKNDYLEKFRIAILSDEANRLNLARLPVRQSGRESRHRVSPYSKNKRRSRLGLADLGLEEAVVGTSVYIDVFLYFGGSAEDRHDVHQLQYYAWCLRSRSDKIRHPEIREYYEQLATVAEEILKELSKGRNKG